VRGARFTIAIALGLLPTACGGGAPAGVGSTSSPVATPAPAGAPASPDAAEAQLLAGVRSDLAGSCVTLGASLPAGATAGIVCEPRDSPVERVTLSLFETQPAMLDAYGQWVVDHGLRPRSHEGRCLGRASEGAYLPGDDLGGTIPHRSACQADPPGMARYAVTLPPFILATLDGAPGADLTAVEGWAWLGNQDTPGGPTIWNEAGPLSPEK
jgi:hypothetical protein